MPKVMIEMEMPKSCRECRFCRYDDKYEEFYCYANYLIPSDVTESVYEHIRRTQCPLHEVKDEKGGNMNKDKFFIIRFNNDIQQAIETTIYPDQLLNKKQALKKILDD